MSRAKKNFIQEAIKKPGSLRAALHVKPGHNITESKLKKAEHSKNHLMAERAHLAETLKHLPRHHGPR